MPPGREAVEGRLTDRVERLDRSEVEAIEAGDWERLDAILDRQRELWRELMVIVAHPASPAEGERALAALRELYDVRRRNHGRIERRLDQLRCALASAHAGSHAADAYQRTARSAA